MRLDKAPWSFETLWRKGATHLTWLLIAIATGGAWVFYFADAPTLARQLVTFEAPVVAYVFVGIFTATTYVLGGIAREQVCIYMCPWPRIQGGDGRPRFPARSPIAPGAASRAGPTRRDKPGRAGGTASTAGNAWRCARPASTFATARSSNASNARSASMPATRSWTRSAGRAGSSPTTRSAISSASGRTSFPSTRFAPACILYATAMAVVGVIMLTALLLRPDLEVNVLHDRNPIYVKLSDGGLRNGYTVKILNKAYEPRSFTIGVSGLPGATLSIVGHDKRADPVVTVPPDELQSVRVYVALDKGAVAALPDAAPPSSLSWSPMSSGATSAEHRATFQGPER